MKNFLNFNKDYAKLIFISLLGILQVQCFSGKGGACCLPRASIITTLCPLTLFLSGEERFITFTNTSNVDAFDVSPDFSGTFLDGLVESTKCNVIPAGGSCSIAFRATSSTAPLTSFSVSGQNTNTVNARIAINPAPKLHAVTDFEVSGGDEYLFTVNPDSAEMTGLFDLVVGFDPGGSQIIMSDGFNYFSPQLNLYNIFDDPDTFVTSYQRINLDPPISTTSLPFDTSIFGGEFVIATGGVFFNDSFITSWDGTATNPFVKFNVDGSSAAIINTTAEPLSGMACYNGKIWAGRPNDISTFPQEDSILEIDSFGNTLSSKTVNAVIPGNFVTGVRGLTVNPSTGDFYAVLWLRANSTYCAFTKLDPVTGNAEFIGFVYCFSSIAFEPADQNCYCAQ